MAVIKNDLITNSLSSVLNPVRQDKVFSKRIIVKHEVATPANNDVILLARIPVEAKLPSIKLASDDLGATGLLNIGFYPVTADIVSKINAGTLADTDAVDEDAIGTLIDVKTAAVGLTEIRFETKDIDTILQSAWELAGLSAKPAYSDFFLAITLAEAVDVGGTVILDITLLD